MTRRPRRKRSVENRLAALESDAEAGQPPVEVVFRDAGTGELTDDDGTPVEPDPDTRTIVFHESVVMGRERAERESREILGPAADTPPERDVVRVAPERP